MSYQLSEKVLMTEFVPQNLGFPHIIREDIIQRNTRPLGNF